MTALTHLGFGTYAPTTRPHDASECGRCVRCHPGKQWGGDEQCHALRVGMSCTCHKGAS